jgi:hypothetical protein
MSEYYVECNPDEEMLQFQKVPAKAIIHCKGSGNIFNKLKKHHNRFALIDEDPQAAVHPYYSELVLTNDAKGVKVYTDKTRNNKVVALSPRFEEWLIQTAKEIKVKLSDFNLPENPHYLHSSINSRLSSLKKLLAEIDKNEGSRLDELKKHFTFS